MLIWPPNSPDLNLIPQLWDVLDKEVRSIEATLQLTELKASAANILVSGTAAHHQMSCVSLLDLGNIKKVVLMLWLVGAWQAPNPYFNFINLVMLLKTFCMDCVLWPSSIAIKIWPLLQSLRSLYVHIFLDSFTSVSRTDSLLASCYISPLDRCHSNEIINAFHFTFLCVVLCVHVYVKFHTWMLLDL